jgi:Methylamine utilisation protein MauE
VLDPDIGILIVTGTAILLTSASVQKWRVLPEFERVLTAYRIVPDRSLSALARLLPALEFAIAVGLAFRTTRPGSALAGAALLLAYAGGIAINLRRNRLDLDCGCAGPNARRPIARWMVIRNVSIAVLLACAAAPWATRPLALPDCLTIGGGLAVAVFLYLATDRLLGQVIPRGAAFRRPS